MARATYDAWLRDAEAVSLEGSVLTVRVNGDTGWLERRLQPLVERTLSRLAERPLQVHFETTEGNHDNRTED